MLINIDPAVLAAAASSETGGTATMAGATAAAAPTCAVVPPGADDVSVRAAAALCARGAATTGILAEYIAMRGLFAGAIGTSGATYEAVEGINQVTSAL
ncbi:PE domain-containing protein [Mycolicibacterium moriokaense]|nr:PE domain-containing protein [Mycolicibacterium moriokaense]